MRALYFKDNLIFIPAAGMKAMGYEFSNYNKLIGMIRVRKPVINLIAWAVHPVCHFL
jgi:hypothetical protein